MNHRFRLLSTALLALVVISAEATESTDKDTFSAANTELFLTDHLSKLKIPSRLVYDFHRTGTLDEKFSDTVEVRFVGSPAEEAKRAEIVFFSGERSSAAPPMTVTDSNPVVMVFLQREVNEMDRLTGGTWRHFQKMIKLALENGAQIEEVQVPYGNQPSPGLKIRITPYLEDPQRHKFAQFAHRQYEFTLSSAVPGYIYQIRTFDPGKDPENGNTARSGPLLEETLIFREIRD